jgi:hypothetical protein
VVTVFEIFVVALLAAKMDDLAFNDPFYPFLFQEIGPALRIADEFGVGSGAAHLVPGARWRKKLLADLLYYKVSDPQQYGVDKKTSHLTFPYKRMSGSRVRGPHFTVRTLPKFFSTSNISSKSAGGSSRVSRRTAALINQSCSASPTGLVL